MRNKKPTDQEKIFSRRMSREDDKDEEGPGR